MSRRADFIGADQLVFCNALRRMLDGSALRRRYRRAQAALQAEGRLRRA